MIKIALIEFPGTNCERETAMAIRRAGMKPISLLWNALDVDLGQFDGFIIPGGFSYEDRVRSGLIAAMNPIIDKLKEQDRLGAPILGICNGAQILVESGLVPGYQDYPLAMALTHNKRVVGENIVGTGFYNAWVNIKPDQKMPRSPFGASDLSGDFMRVSIAHGEGRFIIPQNVMQTLLQSAAVIWRYCDDQGAVRDCFPINPNGSQENIAGISNFAGNVMALMPHPERTTEGDALFISFRQYCAEQKNKKNPSSSLTFRPQIKTFVRPSSLAREFVVESLLTDDAAITLQAVLKNRGLSVSLKRFDHWRICFHDFNDRDLDTIVSSAELANPAKERMVDLDYSFPVEDRFFILVRDPNNIAGNVKQVIFRNHYGLDSIKAIERNDLWCIKTRPEEKVAVKELMSTSPILFNPYVHEHHVFG